MAKQIRCVNSIYVDKTIAYYFSNYGPFDDHTILVKLKGLISNYDFYEINRESLNTTLLKNCEITNRYCDCAEIKLYKTGA